MVFEESALSGVEGLGTTQPAAPALTSHGIAAETRRGQAKPHTRPQHRLPPFENHERWVARDNASDRDGVGRPAAGVARLGPAMYHDAAGGNDAHP